MTISNKLISRFAETIFTNNDADVRRTLPMAGRREALAKFRDVRNASGRQILTISGALGSGKTFFVNNAMSVLINETGFPETQNKVVEFGSRGPDANNPSSADRLRQRFAAADPSHRCVFVVEELDRKGRFRDLVWTIDEALKWLESTDDGLVIMTGDRFLEHPEVQARLAVSEAEVTHLELEPLEFELMSEALTLRLRLVLPNAEHSELAAAASGQILAERDVKLAVLPPTAPPTATFREALGLLLQMCPYIDRTVEGVSFPSQLVVGRARQPRLRPEQRQVDGVVIARISQVIESTRQVEPISAVELQEAIGSNSSPEEFGRRVLYPLVTSQVLVPQGVPYRREGETREDEPFVGPFLPKQNTFLRVLESRIKGNVLQP